MPRDKDLQKALVSKRRADAVKKHLDKCSDVSACKTWTEAEAVLEGFAACIEDILALGAVNGKVDPVVKQVRDEFMEYDECKYYALGAAAAALARALDAGDKDTAGTKRSADDAHAMGAQAETVLDNIMAMLHGVPVPTGKKARITVKNADVLSRMRAEVKDDIAGAEGLKAKQRNKKRKEGVMQLFTASCYQRQFADLWMGLFNIPALPQQRLLVLLDTMHTAIIPYLPSPLVLFDFLSDAYEAGGLAGILALNSLFILMVEHGLEFPAFFDKLYQLLTPDVCVMRQRGRFFELVGKFLNSVGLSAGVLAAFVKRACRLSLFAPTPAVFFLTTLVKILLVKNPQLMVLIHRERRTIPDDEEQVERVWEGEDPYDPSEPMPEQSGAIDSSCWELRALLEHYNPTIAQTAKELLEELKAPVGGSAPLLSARAGRTYSRMITREILKDIKTVPSTAYTTPVPYVAAKDEQAAAKVTALSSAFAF